MKKLFVVLIALGALYLPGVVRRGRAQDSLQYILMIVNQGTQITNQGLALTRMDTHIGQLTGQFEHLKESALGQIGAIADPIADLIAVPTDLLNTARDWHSDFTGQASSLIDALTELDDGTSLSESWRDVLQEADTVSAADIRNIYQSNSNAADAAVAIFERQRTTRIAALSWHMHAPMPPRLSPPRRPKSRTRSTPSPAKTMFPIRRCNKQSWPGISPRDNF